MLKTACNGSVEWRRWPFHISKVQEKMEASLVPSFPRWRSYSAIGCFEDVVKEFGDKETIIKWIQDAGIYEEKQLLKIIYSKMLAMKHPSSLVDFFSRRLQYWFRDIDAKRFAAKMPMIINNVFKCIPPCVQFAVVNTWLNGWPTNRRLHLPFAWCRLCGGCYGEDSLNHYWESPHQSCFLGPQFQKQNSTRKAAYFLFDDESFECLCIRSCHIYAVRKAFNAARSMGCRFTREECQSHIKAGHKTCRLLSNEICKIMKHGSRRRPL